MAIEMLTRSLLSHSCMCVCAQFIPDVYVVFLWSFPPHAHASLVFPADFELAFVFFRCIGLSPSHTLIKSSKCISLNVLLSQTNTLIHDQLLQTISFVSLQEEWIELFQELFRCGDSFAFRNDMHVGSCSICCLRYGFWCCESWRGLNGRGIDNELPRRLLPIRTGI